MNTSHQNRSKWSGQLAFILAGAASAVGLGNLWRFPYLAAEYGGGIFLLTYLILVVTFGFSLMIAEVTLGRMTGLSGLTAFKALNRRFAFIGWIVTAIPVIILPYYCVIGGWVGRYLAAYLSNLVHVGSLTEPTLEGFFESFITHPFEPLQFGLFFVALTFLIVIFGIKRGIERANKIMMPLLLIAAIGLISFTLTQPGSRAGLVYFLKPNFADFSYKTVLAAMGQMFYSLSLAMGIMITYGSYLKKEEPIEKSVRHIEVFDTFVSVLAGLLIIPAVFVFKGGEAGNALSSGPGLMFVTLPNVFEKMPGSNLIASIFFLLVFFAALTSAISLMETIVSSIQDRLKIERFHACLITLGLTALLAIPSALGYGSWKNIQFFGSMQFLDFFDFISNSVLMPLAALLTCIFVGWILKPAKIMEEANHPIPFKAKKLFSVMIRYIAPLLVIAILVTAVLETFKIIEKL